MKGEEACCSLMIRSQSFGPLVTLDHEFHQGLSGSAHSLLSWDRMAGEGWRWVFLLPYEDGWRKWHWVFPFTNVG